MDTLTHALSGALIARATEPATPRPDQLPRRTRLWVGFWAAAFPDSDFITRLIDPLTYLTLHRGITHSVVLLPVWAMGLSFLFLWLVREKYSWRAFVGVVALGIGIHILGDVITAFGTMILAPLSTWRAQIPTTFIIDLYFTTIIIAGLIAAAIWGRTRAPAVLGLTVLCAYVGFQWFLHQRAVAVGESYVQTQELKRAEVAAIPQPFSPFHWMIVISQPDFYRLSYVSLWRDAIPETPAADAHWLRRLNASYYPAGDAVWQIVPRYGKGPDAALAEQVWSSGPLTAYRRFALFPALYRIDRAEQRTCVWFQDMRFALLGRDMPFRYGACREHAGPWRVYRLSNDNSGREFYDRIPD